jgi:hypothetical protein
MSKSMALLKNLTMFLLAFAVLSFLYSYRLPAEEHGGRVVLWIATMMVWAKFAGPVLFVILVWTAIGHGQPSIHSDSESQSMFDDDHRGPRASANGEPMRNGLDPSGSAYGTDHRDY